MSQNFASNLTSQLEQQTQTLLQLKAQLVELQLSFKHLLSDINNSVNSCMNSAVSTTETTTASLTQLSQQNKSMQQVITSTDQQLIQLTNSIQQLSNLQPLVNQVNQQIQIDLEQVQQQLKTATVNSEQLFNSYHTLMDQHIQKIISTLKVRYTAIATLFIFIVILCLTSYFARETTLKMSELNWITTEVSDKQQELQKYKIAISQAQTHLSRARR